MPPIGYLMLTEEKKLPFVFRMMEVFLLGCHIGWQSCHFCLGRILELEPWTSSMLEGIPA